MAAARAGRAGPTRHWSTDGAAGAPGFGGALNLKVYIHALVLDGVFVPPIIHFSELDSIVQANDGDAILMAQLLAQHGLAVGISAGANVIGALRVQQQVMVDKIVSVPRASIVRAVGRCHEATSHAVEDALRNWLAL